MSHSKKNCIKTFYADYFAMLRFTVLRNFMAPSTWLVLAGSLVVLNALTFYVGDVWSHNNANMALFWGYFPFVLTVLAPLLAMRGAALEKQTGTYDWLMTKPLSPFAVDAGFFKSQMLLYTLWLTASLVLPFSFAFLANPDGLLLAAGYLGALLLGGVFIAGAFMAASVANTVVGAFVGGFLVSMLILFSASEGLAALLPFAMTTKVSSLLMSISPMFAFERMQNGLVLWADVILLLFVQTIFMLIGHGLRQRKTFKKSTKRKLTAIIVLLLAGIGLSQVYINEGYDLTADNRYKPSKSALQVVRDLPTDRITLQFYFSETSPSLSSADRAFGRQVKYYLQTLARRSDKVRFDMLDPTHSAKVEQIARRQKIEPVVAADGARMYMGIVASTPEKSIVIPALPRERQDLFEFDLMNNLVRLRHEQTRRIVVLTGMNMADKKQRPEFLEKLAPFYRVDINNHRNAIIPDDNDLVIVLNGYYLAENALYALDQYVQRGGKVLAFIDPFWFASPVGSMQATGPDDGVTSKPGFDDLLRHWGLGYIPGRLVADPSLGTAIQVTDSAGVATHPLWLTLKSAEINQKVNLSKGLTKISVAAPGFFDMLNPEGIQLTPILQTSPAAQWLPRSKVFEVNLENMAEYFEGTPQQYTLAAKAEGAFKPFYPRRPAGAIEWIGKKTLDWPKEYRYDHFEGPPKLTKVIAVADMDFYSPQLSLRGSSKGRSMTPSNDNLNLLFNMVRDLLGEPEALKIQLRHEANRRPFVVLDQHLSKIAARFSADEQAMVSKLMSVRRKLADKRHDASRKKFDDPTLQKQINELDFEELKTLHEIDHAREKAFKAARNFIGGLTALIVFGGGALLVLFGWCFRICHRRKVAAKLKAV